MSATTGLSAARTRRRRVLLLARPERRASRAASGRLCRHPPGRRLCRLRSSICDRRPGPIIEAACWSHGRRNFFELAESPQARREQAATPSRRSRWRRSTHRRDLRHRAQDQRPAGRRRLARAPGKEARWSPSSKHGCAPNAPGSRATPSRQGDRLHAEALAAFTRFLDDGRICLTNNAAERACAALRSGASLAVRRLRPRRRTRGGDVHADRHRQAQRRSIRRPGSPTCSPHRRSSCARLDELLPWHWAAERQRRNLAA